MGTNFPFCFALGLEMPFKSPGKHLELAMGSHGVQGPYTGGVGMVQPPQPYLVGVCVLRELTLMAPQGQPGTLDVP